jgi:hypothetical protein
MLQRKLQALVLSIRTTWGKSFASVTLVTLLRSLGFVIVAPENSHGHDIHVGTSDIVVFTQDSFSEKSVLFVKGDGSPVFHAHIQIDAVQIKNQKAELQDA